MTVLDRSADAQIKAMMRTLGWLDVEYELEMALAERRRADGLHPPHYDIGSVACGNVSDDARYVSLASHLATCASCRAERDAFRELLPHKILRQQTTENKSAMILPFPYHPPVPSSALFVMPSSAAAAGGRIRQRSSPDATIRLIPVNELPGRVVVAIQLEHSRLLPRLMRVHPPARPSFDEQLPHPDEQGLIQFIKDASRQCDRRFLELILDVPLDFIGSTAE